MTNTTPDHTGNREPMAEQARAQAADLAESAKETARDAADSVGEEAARRAESAKSSVAAEVSDVASGLRKAAEEMRNGSPQERTFGQVAESLADASDALRDKDLGQIMHELNGFARRNPIAFLGGAVLTGFAASRFATASRRGHGTDSPSAPSSAAGGGTSVAPNSNMDPTRGMTAPSTPPTPATPTAGGTTVAPNANMDPSRGGLS